MPKSQLSDLEGKVILITGGASGIGETAAYAFSDVGASITLQMFRLS